MLSASRRHAAKPAPPEPGQDQPARTPSDGQGPPAHLLTDVTRGVRDPRGGSYAPRERKLGLVAWCYAHGTPPVAVHVPALPDQDPVAPRLRVQIASATSSRSCRDTKSIDDSAPLPGVLSGGTANYVGETRLVPGHVRVSARLLPVRRGGVLVSRVVTSLRRARGAPLRARSPVRMSMSQ